MLKYYRMLILASAILFPISVNATVLTFKCTNIRGVSVKSLNGELDVSKDGFSGQDIILRVDTQKAKAALPLAEIQWKGRNNFTVPVMITGNNAADAVMFFSQLNNEVGRSYAFFLERMVMTFVEQQTALRPGKPPEIRSFITTCTQR